MEPTADPPPKLLTQHPPVATPPTAPGCGRRRILSDAKCQEICTLVTAGCGTEDAARHVGCVPRTILREARRNPDFGNALQQAQLTAELDPLNAMRSAAARHWRAAAWLLERTNPQRFARLSIETIRPDDLQAFARNMSIAISVEVTDQIVRTYLIGRLRFFVEELHRDAWLKAKHQEIKPVSDPFVSPKQARRAAAQQFRDKSEDHNVHASRQNHAMLSTGRQHTSATALPVAPPRLSRAHIRALGRARRAGQYSPGFTLFFSVRRLREVEVVEPSAHIRT